MKKIIHLSDWHVGFGDCGPNLREVIRWVIFLKEPGADYVVVITGDLVQDATQFDAYAAPRRAIDQLTDAGFRVLVCPGNHDYGTGTLGSKAYVERFKAAFFGDTSVEYPKLDIIDGAAFIGLDSMARELDWYDRLFAEGELGMRQLESLATMLRRPDVVACTHRIVYLHHHPFDPRPFHQLRDSEELQQLLRTHSVDVLLYGHNHEGKKANGKLGIPRCYDAGTTTRKEGKPGPIRVMDLSGDAQLDDKLDFFEGLWESGSP